MSYILSGFIVLSGDILSDNYHHQDSQNIIVNDDMNSIGSIDIIIEITRRRSST